jgi:hypothetical protein
VSATARDPNVLDMFVVYDRPKDFPTSIVVRRWEVRAGESRPTDSVWTAPTLAEARAQLPPGLHLLGRWPEDDPCIAEVWL